MTKPTTTEHRRLQVIAAHIFNCLDLTDDKEALRIILQAANAITLRALQLQEAECKSNTES